MHIYTHLQKLPSNVKFTFPSAKYNILRHSYFYIFNPHIALFRIFDTSNNTLYKKTSRNFKCMVISRHILCYIKQFFLLSLSSLYEFILLVTFLLPIKGTKKPTPQWQLWVIASLISFKDETATFWAHTDTISGPSNSH